MIHFPIIVWREKNQDASKRILNQNGLDDRDYLTQEIPWLQRDSIVFYKAVVIFETKILAEGVKRGHRDHKKKSEQ